MIEIVRMIFCEVKDFPRLSNPSNSPKSSPTLWSRMVPWSIIGSRTRRTQWKGASKWWSRLSSLVLWKKQRCSACVVARRKWTGAGSAVLDVFVSFCFAWLVKYRCLMMSGMSALRIGLHHKGPNGSKWPPLAEHQVVLLGLHVRLHHTAVTSATQFSWCTKLHNGLCSFWLL